MTYLQSKLMLILICGFGFVFPSSYVISQAEDYTCLNQALSPAKVMKVDGTAIFVVVDAVSVKMVRKTIPKVKKCLLAAGWGGDIWSIVYFSNEKYTGYTGDPEIAKLNLAEWKKSYLALYEHSKGKLTLCPARNPKIYYLDPKKVSR